MLRSLACRSLLILLSSGLAAAWQPTDGKWVSYTARYTESLSTRGPSGNQSSETSEVDEFRAADGSVLSVTKVDGKLTKGKLWLANGAITELNYSQRQAATTNHAPRTHLEVPKTPPFGSAVIAGLPCSIYPVQISGGKGELCVDVSDDILLKEEFHLDGGGKHTDYVKEVSSIDLNTPVDSSQMKIPEGFTKLVPVPGATK